MSNTSCWNEAVRFEDNGAREIMESRGLNFLSSHLDLGRGNVEPVEKKSQSKRMQFFHEINSMLAISKLGE
jgi:hypothetical protein